MEPELTNEPAQDAQSVSAVRSGDVERYRELVERHERRVFAVAWSRLGDAALAEEAAQEAFIRGYRRLWLLGDGAKFSAWITTIARHAAINLGLRHRRELDKRERWALEPAEKSEPASEESNEVCTSEMLRQTLTELPAAHRECLVLYYLDGRSGAEAAAALGISEAAFRVRLHRARGALREQLEGKLEGSLEKLRPARTLVPAVMAGVLASSSAKAATAGGVGATVLGALGKFTPFKWLFLVLPLLMPVLMILPGLLFHRWRMRDEQRNYRDPEGFRARLHGRFPTAPLMIFLFVMVLCMFLATRTGRFFGPNTLLLGIGLFSSIGLVVAIRRLEVNRSRSQLINVLNYFVLSVFCLGGGLGWLPGYFVIPGCLLSSVLTVFVNGIRPLRMDYNLFLRAAQGVLPPIEASALNRPGLRFDRAPLRAFARFLSERQLARDFCWQTDGLSLHLPPVKLRLPDARLGGLFPSLRNDSHILLEWDGSVAAHCGKKDAADMDSLQSRASVNLDKLETEVATATADAWRSFREGKIDAAERATGQVPDSEIFVVPPSRTTATRWQRVVLGVLVAVGLGLLGAAWLFSPRLAGLKPVTVTEGEVRAFLNDTTRNPDPKLYRGNSAGLGLVTRLVLPRTNLFTPQGLSLMRAEIQTGWQPDETSKVLSFCGLLYGRRAMLCGWIDWNDLGFTPRDVSDYIREHKNETGIQFRWELLLTHGDSWSWVKEQRFPVTRLDEYGLTQLRWLRLVNCLDLVDQKKVIQKIAAVQVLSGTPSPGEPPIHDWRDVRGLFFTPSWPALQETYYSLAALEILGGLDKIDREQCIRGILRRHHGRGYFTSPDPGGYNEYKIVGDARDTFCAFESLRILGALDRVKDLDQWQFRPEKYHGAGPQPKVTWNDVEAWVCQQRFEKIMQAGREHSDAPVRSLLEP